jgi:phosphate transport system protein
MTTHFEESLQRNIDRIRDKVSEMAALCEDNLRASLKAVTENSRQLAYSVILRDQRIDELEKELDRLCLEFLLRQQPVAGPLRLVYVTIKMNRELERIGDYAESIARQVLKLGELGVHAPSDRSVEVANISIPMFHDAIRAFIEQDCALARKTMGQANEADALRNTINAELLQWCRDHVIPPEALTALMTIVRRLERLADQAQNICEDVVYMCTGEYSKHKGAEAYRILFVDEHDACRSQLAQGIGNAMGQSKFVFSSAGLQPEPVDPMTVTFLREKGIDISRATSKSIDQVPNLEHYQIIVVLAKEAKSAFSPPPAKTVLFDWSIKDPSQTRGDTEKVRAAYDAAFQSIQNHVRDLVEAILADKIE